MTKTTIEWSQEVDKRQDGLIALRRDFHRHPELSFEERRTAEIIAERLHGAKLEVRTGIAGTGVVGILHGDRPGRTIAWRADIDALPLTERLEAPFTSGTTGVMHACGHDGHTAIAITMAEIMSARRARGGGHVRLHLPARGGGHRRCRADDRGGRARRPARRRGVRAPSHDPHAGGPRRGAARAQHGLVRLLRDRRGRARAATAPCRTCPSTR